MRTIGLALRLAYALSAGAPGVLERTTLEIVAGRLVPSVPDNDSLFRGGSFQRRLERLAEHIGLDAEIDRI